MISSILRIVTIGRITLTEAVRQKVLTVLLLFGLCLVGSSVLFSKFATEDLNSAGLFVEQIKSVKDTGCGSIEIIGFFIAVLSTALMIPQEMQNRTIYTILAKPVRRAEFLLGKFLGNILLVALCVTLMSLAFAGSLYWQEVQAIDQAKVMYNTQDPKWDQNNNAKAMYDHDIAQIKAQVRDPQVVEAILLIFAELIMISAIAMLISTFATSWIFTVITTAMIYLIGHWESIARAAWLARGPDTNMWQSGMVGLISLLIPDLNSFTIVDEILAGNRVPWAHTLNLLGYADIYILVLLAVSIVIFEFREL